VSLSQHHSGPMTVQASLALVMRQGEAHLVLYQTDTKGTLLKQPHSEQQRDLQAHSVHRQALRHDTTFLRFRFSFVCNLSPFF